MCSTKRPSGPRGKCSTNSIAGANPQPKVGSSRAVQTPAKPGALVYGPARFVECFVNKIGPIAVDKAAAAAGVVRRLTGVIRDDRLMTDALMTYAYSGDASSYRL